MSIKDILPTRTPGAALAEAERLGAVLDELDQTRGRLQVAEDERDQLGRELDEVAAQRDAAVVERDDLSARSLPYLDTATWPSTPSPPGTITYERLAEESGVRPDEPIVDDPAAGARSPSRPVLNTWRPPSVPTDWEAWERRYDAGWRPDPPTAAPEEPSAEDEPGIHFEASDSPLGIDDLVIGPASVVYVATCEECSPVLYRSWSDPEKRHEWVQEHRSTGHRVRLSRETQ